jgi:hypothetical protein
MKTMMFDAGLIDQLELHIVSGAKRALSAAETLMRLSRKCIIVGS